MTFFRKCLRLVDKKLTKLEANIIHWQVELEYKSVMVQQ